MPVNIEIKGNLAKLLATENLIIEHKNVDTASFDVKRRVLTLPQWNIDSNFVYDLLVAHEVGHALFTPNRNYREEEEYKNLPFDYVNVVEDARIEKLMKQKYAGLNRDFYKGYEELHAQNFFEVDEDQLDNLKLIDRVNLYFKVGAYLCFDFTDTENQLITDITKAETFDEVLALSKKLYELSKAQQEQAQQDLQALEIKLDAESQDMDGTPESMTEQESTDEQDDDAEEKEGKGDTIEQTLEDKITDPDDFVTVERAGNHSDIDTSDTQRSFDKNAEELNKSDMQETTYVSLPQVDLDRVVIGHETLREQLKAHFTLRDIEDGEASKYFNYYLNVGISDFNKFKLSARKDVNNLVKEFEMKKSADSYSRSATSRTGMLDMTKLHTYKYNEDIFKKVTTIPEGKNHGLVFLLDWSGSMHNILEDTLKQLFNLVWFCRKVQIPFEVYAFTNDSYMLDPELNELSDTNPRYMSERELEPYRITQPIIGNIHIPQTFRLVNVLSSQQRTRDLDESMRLLWLQTYALVQRHIDSHRSFNLSGTPLNEAIIAVGQLAKEIIKSRKIQKCHIVVLTDGDGFHSDYYTQSSYDDHVYNRALYSGHACIRVGSKTFTGGSGSGSSFTEGVVKAVKSTLPNCSFLGIRLLERDYRYFYMNYARHSHCEFGEMNTQKKKEGMIHFTTDAFDKWYGISATKLRVDDELEVDSGADKRSISTAFKKMNRGKKTNKVMVKQFIDQIA